MKDKKLLLLPLLLLTALFIFQCLAELRGAWEGDTDYLMYHATRLLHGELPWVKEFDDKLPLTHFIFILPALMKSARIWQLMSILSITASSIVIYFSLKNMLISVWGVARRRATVISSYATALNLYLYAFMPGSISTVNPFSASFFMLGALMEMKWFREDGNKINLRLTANSAIASLLVAVSVSIRPYFILPAVLIGTWKALRTREITAKRPGAFGIIAYTVQWSALIAAFCLLLNYLPYAVTDNTEVFKSAIMVLGQKYVPSCIFEVARRQLKDIINLSNIAFAALSACAFLAISCVAGTMKGGATFTRKQFVDILFAAILMPVLLELTILGKHYANSHYLVFFAPFAVLSAAMLMALLLNKLESIKNCSETTKKMLAALALILFLFSVRADAASSVARALYPNLDMRIAEYLTIKSPKYAGRIGDNGFLYPESMYMHWKMDEFRRGFPNPTTTDLILNNSWDHMHLPGNLHLPKNREEFCQKLIVSGPKFIITHDNTAVAGALEKELSGIYRRSFILDSDLMRITGSQAETCNCTQLGVYERNEENDIINSDIGQK